MDLRIQNETATLKKVVIGSAYDIGGMPSPDACFDPKSLQHVMVIPKPAKHSYN